MVVLCCSNKEDVVGISALSSEDLDARMWIKRPIPLLFVSELNALGICSSASKAREQLKKVIRYITESVLFCKSLSGSCDRASCWALFLFL